MLTPVNIFSFSRTSAIKNFSNKKNKINYTQSPIVHKIPKKDIFFRSNYILEDSKKPSFEETIDENYFKLPKIMLKGGIPYQFKPDRSQIECAKKLYNGDSVVYCAPTGTGKTAVAHYVITKNLKEGKSTIYTTPLKALANDKMREFQRVYGEENVGLLTGDIKINTSAPIQIMTTEIYNNQVSTSNRTINNLGTIIYDEAHYLGNEERGNVWENSIINTPIDKTQILCLSATIGNGDELTDWISSLDYLRNVSKVELDSKERYVPLVHSIYVPKGFGSDKTTGKFVLLTKGSIDVNGLSKDQIDSDNRLKRALEIFYKAKNEKSPYYEMTKENYEEAVDDLKNLYRSPKEYNTAKFKRVLKKRYPYISDEKIIEISEFLVKDKTVRRIDVAKVKDDYFQLIEDMKELNMLPALIFKLSRGQAEDIIPKLKEAGCDLTTKEEKEKIKKILEKYKEEDIYLGNNFDKEALIRGYAYHHAGKVPQYRKLVEELFSKKLLKVVSATSTLSAGINMPAKTVVIGNTAYKKYNPYTDNVEYVSLTANDFAQMAGRAGRRGIDEIGYVVLYNLYTNDGEYIDISINDDTSYDDNLRPDELQNAYNLILKTPEKLESKYKPNWNMIMDYYTKNSEDKNLKTMLERTFKAYLSENKEETINELLKEFEKYRNILEKLDFLRKTDDGKIEITPKGKILSMYRGANPLVISSLLYDGKIKNLDYIQLCQILGYAISGDTKEEDISQEEISKIGAEYLLEKSSDYKDYYLKYEQAENVYLNCISKIYRTMKEDNVLVENQPLKDSFSGLISFSWAYLNALKDTPIENFKTITTQVKNLPQLNDDSLKELFEEKGVKNEYKRKSNEGNIYDVIAQTTTALKQIEKICNYAIKNPLDFQDIEYWEDLRMKVINALTFTLKNPIGDAMMI